MGFLKLLADRFLPDTPWWVPWNRPVAFALLLVFFCLSGEVHTRSRGEGPQYFRPCALAKEVTVTAEHEVVSAMLQHAKWNANGPVRARDRLRAG